MEINEFQDKAWAIIEEYNKKNKGAHKPKLMFFHLVEEVGELARQLYNEQDNWRKDFDKENFDEELIDILFFILIISKDYNVNIEETFNKKIDKLKHKFESKTE